MSTEVLVVGAGPSGLSAALFLASRGRRVTIIDKNVQRTDKSKAIGVQAGTLELLGATFGEDLPQQMMGLGIAARELFFHTDLGRLFHIRFGDLPSRFNALLMLRQSETERILEERLAQFGVHVQRQTELMQLKQATDHVLAHLQGPEGPSNVHSQYLIGADGAHSRSRQLLGMDFEGGTYDGQFVLADLRVEWPWSHGGVHVFLSAQGAAAFFPLTGSQQYRLILIPRNGRESTEATELNLESLREESAHFLPAEVQLSQPVWMTRFRVHHRLTKKMGEGRVFLCGDAAHIHSPLGAQGMNTGIHDALDLSWRLERILKGTSSPEILNGFLADRHRNAEQVVHLTDLAFRGAMARENVLTALARRHLLPRLITQPFLQKRLLRAVSEIDVARRIVANMQASGENAVTH